MKKILIIILICTCGGILHAQKTVSMPCQDDICGIWVSDLSYSYDKNAIGSLVGGLFHAMKSVSDLSGKDNTMPYVAIEIMKDNNGYYLAQILPYCILANQHKMYNGSPFNYKPRSSKIDANTYFAYSNQTIIHSEKNIISFYFGDERFRGSSKQAKELLVKPTVDIIVEMGKAIKQSLAANLAASDFTTSLKIGLTDIGVDLLVAGITKLMEPKKTTTVFNFNMKELFPGCANLDIIETSILEKPSKPTQQTETVTPMRIYKLYPDDNILFAAVANELFGYRKFDKNEIMEMDEYEHLQALKGIGYFNKQAYKKLEQQVNDIYESIAPEDMVMQIIVEDCLDRLEFATQGLTYKRIDNKTGKYEGWMDLSGRMNGLGLCELNTGYKYVGNWENNKFSGKGTLYTHCPDATKKCPPYEKYEGTFKDGKYHGEGKHISDNITYEGYFADGKYNGKGKYKSNNSFYDGEFANGKFHGEGKYTDDSTFYEGYFVNGKYHGKGNIKRLITGNSEYNSVREYRGYFVGNKYSGTGMLIDINGDVFEGTWKNGYLVKGTVKYNTGDIYTGTFKYLKNTDAQLQKEMMLPHGNGIMTQADGEYIAGKWKDGKFVEKKQKNVNKKVDITK
jgi:hypothetical protein